MLGKWLMRRPWRGEEEHYAPAWPQGLCNSTPDPK